MSFNTTPVHYPEYAAGVVLLALAAWLWRGRQRAVGGLGPLAVFLGAYGLSINGPILTGDDPFKPVVLVASEISSLVAAGAFIAFARETFGRSATTRELALAYGAAGAIAFVAIILHLRDAPQTYERFLAPPLEYPPLAARLVSLDGTFDHVLHGAIVGSLLLLASRLPALDAGSRRAGVLVALAATAFLARAWGRWVLGADPIRGGLAPIAMVAMLLLVVAWLWRTGAGDRLASARARDLAIWTAAAPLIVLVLLALFPSDGTVAYGHAVAWRAYAPGTIVLLGAPFVGAGAK